MKQNKYYRVLRTIGTRVYDNQEYFGALENLQKDFPTSDGWLIVDPAELPADFSVETYTIVNGELVKASADVIAEREAKKREAYNEQQRLARQAEYRAVTDPQVIEMLADTTPEIAALKEAIRAKYPYKV